MRAFVNGSDTTWGPVTCCVVDIGPALRCQWAQEALNNICLKLPDAVSGRNRVIACMVVVTIGCSAFGVASAVALWVFRVLFCQLCRPARIVILNLLNLFNFIFTNDRKNNQSLVRQPVHSLKLSLAPFLCSLRLHSRIL